MVWVKLQDSIEETRPAARRAPLLLMSTRDLEGNRKAHLCANGFRINRLARRQWSHGPESCCSQPDKKPLMKVRRFLASNQWAGGSSPSGRATKPRRISHLRNFQERRSTLSRPLRRGTPGLSSRNVEKKSPAPRYPGASVFPTRSSSIPCTHERRAPERSP